MNAQKKAQIDFLRQEFDGNGDAREEIEENSPAQSELIKGEADYNDAEIEDRHDIAQEDNDIADLRGGERSQLDQFVLSFDGENDRRYDDYDNDEDSADDIDDNDNNLSFAEISDEDVFSDVSGINDYKEADQDDYCDAVSADQQSGRPIFLD